MVVGNPRGLFGFLFFFLLCQQFSVGKTLDSFCTVQP